MQKLQIWEGTQDYREQFEKSKERFSGIKERLWKRDFTCTYLGDLRFDINAEPEVWFNDNTPLGAYRYCKTPDHAKRIALKHGRSGWWRLDDLDKFADKEGPIFEEAMWNLGYRRRKRDNSQWAKRTKNDGVEDSRKVYLNERFVKKYMELGNEELERLNQLWVMSNDSAGLSKTYNIQAGRTGMIHIALWANPFVGTSAETLHLLGEQINNRGHIAKQQQGFYMHAVNVRLRGEEGVYVKAANPDESSIECIWPSQIPSDSIYDLFNGFIDRVLPVETTIG